MRVIGGFTTNHHSLETNVPVAPAPDDAAVREQLGRILESSHFRTSKRCQSLLRYVVEAYLENHFEITALEASSNSGRQKRLSSVIRGRANPQIPRPAAATTATAITAPTVARLHIRGFQDR